MTVVGGATTMVPDVLGWKPKRLLGKGQEDNVVIFILAGTVEGDQGKQVTQV